MIKRYSNNELSSILVTILKEHTGTELGPIKLSTLGRVFTKRFGYNFLSCRVGSLQRFVQNRKEIFMLQDDKVSLWKSDQYLSSTTEVRIQRKSGNSSLEEPIISPPPKSLCNILRVDSDNHTKHSEPSRTNTSCSYENMISARRSDVDLAPPSHMQSSSQNDCSTCCVKSPEGFVSISSPTCQQISPQEIALSQHFAIDTVGNEVLRQFGKGFETDFNQLGTKDRLKVVTKLCTVLENRRQHNEIAEFKKSCWKEKQKIEEDKLKQELEYNRIKASLAKETLQIQKDESMGKMYKNYYVTSLWVCIGVMILAWIFVLSRRVNGPSLLLQTKDYWAKYVQLLLQNFWFSFSTPQAKQEDSYFGSFIKSWTPNFVLDTTYSVFGGVMSSLGYLVLIPTFLLAYFGIFYIMDIRCRILLVFFTVFCPFYESFYNACINFIPVLIVHFLVFACLYARSVEAQRLTVRIFAMACLASVSTFAGYYSAQTDPLANITNGGSQAYG